jgi:hypothetical protein
MKLIIFEFERVGWDECNESQLSGLFIAGIRLRLIPAYGLAYQHAFEDIFQPQVLLRRVFGGNPIRLTCQRAGLSSIVAPLGSVFEGQAKALYRALLGNYRELFST